MDSPGIGGRHEAHLDATEAAAEAHDAKAEAAPQVAASRSHPPTPSAPFTRGAHRAATTLGPVQAHELKLSPDMNRIRERIEANAEAGDVSIAAAYSTDPAALRKAMAKPADLKLVAFYAMARPMSDGDDPVSWPVATHGGGFDPKLIELRSIPRADALKVMTKATEAGSDRSPERAQLERDLKTALDSMLSDPATSVFKFHWNPNSAIEGVVAMNLRTGEVRVLGQFYGG